MKPTSDEYPSIPFLKSLLQHCVAGFLDCRFIHKETRKTIEEFIPLDSLESLPGYLRLHKNKSNCYFSPATRGQRSGTKEAIHQISSLWLDLDRKDFPSEDEWKNVKQRIVDFPLKPTFVVGTGGGLHAYWRLREPATNEEISRIENVLDRLADYFQGDHASTDASHILRIPGTLNWKYDPSRNVAVVYPKEGAGVNEYNLEDFESLLPEVKEPCHSEEREYSQERNERLDQIMECEFLKHCDKDRKILSEPEWYAMVSILAKETGSRNLIHGLSKGYPKYSPGETDQKILHANDTGPATCERIKKELWDCKKDCGVKSPVVLAGGAKRGDSTNPTNEHHFCLVRAGEIVNTEIPQREWIWEDRLPSGGSGLVIAKPKVGKTTFSLGLAVAVSRGDTYLGKKTRQGTVVYLALEEHRDEVQKKLSKMGVTDEPLYIHFGPAPAQAMQEVEPLITETGAKLLVIDILQKFCRVKDLNDYSMVTRALEPIMSTARKMDCHILMNHHAGKRDREDGDDILGSTGLLGGVDTSIHIKKREKRRTFFTIQRYGQDVPETVLELQENGDLTATGSREEVEVAETVPLILEALNVGPLPEKEIWERVEKGHSLVSRGLRVLVESDQVKRSGGGKRGDPFVYEKKSLLLSSLYMEESRREMKSGDNPKEILENNSPDDFQKNQPPQERIGRDILTPKEPEKEGLFKVMDDGQITY